MKETPECYQILGMDKWQKISTHKKAQTDKERMRSRGKSRTSLHHVSPKAAELPKGDA